MNSPTLNPPGNDAPPKKSVFLLSLGCAKNRVDSEHMLGILRSEGFALTPRIEEARIAVINTCGFVGEAVQEAIGAVLDAARRKAEGRLDRVIVCGCLAQRYGYKLRREIPEVDGWLGTGEFPRIAHVVEGGPGEAVPFHISKPEYLADHMVPRVRSTAFFTAYMKIAEGCSHACSYCIIPKLRGRFRSRPMNSLLAEARILAAQGVKEVNLVAQDTTRYGADLPGRETLEDLLEALVRMKGFRWIRLLYCHPEGISDRLLGIIEDHEEVCPYLDIPFQHVNRNLLRAMGRDPGRESPLKLIERIRTRRRPISLRTTLMVGFPGETDAMFQELCGFVRAVAFDHLGVFAFSPEQGARAASFRPRIPEEVGAARMRKMMRIQSGISKRKNQVHLGRTLPVLIEGESPETGLLLTGRTSTMAPEVDGRVLVNKGRGIVGEVMPVHIREVHPYDLVGEIAE